MPSRLGGVRIDPVKLRACRDMKGLTQAALAQRTGISAESISAYERGIRRPEGKFFRRLFTALGVGPEDLLTEEEAKAAKAILAARRTAVTDPAFDDNWEDG